MWIKEGVGLVDRNKKVAERLLTYFGLQRAKKKLLADSLQNILIKSRLMGKGVPGGEKGRRNGSRLSPVLEPPPPTRGGGVPLGLKKGPACAA